MGGEWGVGAALTFETLPAEGHDCFGPAAGRLCCRVSFRGTGLWHLVSDRGLARHVCGGNVPHSSSFISERMSKNLQRGLKGGLSQNLRRQWGEASRVTWGSFLFLVILMFGFNSFSHGTQDLYPTFLEKNHFFSPQQVRTVSVIASLGALLGGMCLGAFQKESADAARLSSPHCSRFL